MFGVPRFKVTMLDHLQMPPTQAFVKMAAFGIVCNGPRSYFRSPWNVLDFVVLCSCVLVLALEPLTGAMWSIMWIRALRGVR